MAPGAVTDEVAKRYGVRVALIGSWRRRATRAATGPKKPVNAPRFAAVRLDPGISDNVIKIDLGNRCIECEASWMQQCYARCWRRRDDIARD